MPQYSYDAKTAFAGQIAQALRPTALESYANPKKAKIHTTTIAGFDAGTYTIRLSKASTGEEFDISAAAGASIALTCTALETAGDAMDELLNIVVVSKTATTVVLSFIHPGDDWDISYPSNPNSNMSGVTTQAAGGTDIPVGVAVVAASNPGDDDNGLFCALPSGSSVDANFIGITTRNVASNVMDYDQTGQVSEPGDIVSVMTEGVIWVETEDTVAYGGTVYVRITASGSEQLGAFRSDADGGDAIVMTGAKFYSATSGAGLAKIKINRP
jgi:hypothetical protein